MNNRSVNVIEDLEGRKIVIIQDIIFQGRRNINWNDVEKYLRKYIGQIYENDEFGDLIYIGSDLPDEYTHSNYTYNLKGLKAKIKANASQAIPELISTARSKAYEPNYKLKHDSDAKFGWYTYVAYVAMPVFNEQKIVTRYNVFNVLLLIRKAASGKMYLYDITQIKKETSNLFAVSDCTQ